MENKLQFKMSERNQNGLLDGTVTEQTGPVSYKVLVGDQPVWNYHIDQMHYAQIEPVQIAAQMFAKLFREVLIIKKSVNVQPISIRPMRSTSNIPANRAKWRARQKYDSATNNRYSKTDTSSLAELSNSTVLNSTVPRFSKPT